MGCPLSNRSDNTKFDYPSHLKLDRLLGALQPTTDHPEEHIFITAHHSLELWFKQVLFDLKRTIDLLNNHQLNQANWLLRRIGEILRLAEGHWTILEMMSAADFAEFRGQLTGASGMQSKQFRTLEVMIGLHETAGKEYVQRVEREWPDLIKSHPNTLRKAFFATLEQSGKSLLEIYQNRWEAHDLFQLAENAFELDRRIHSWRNNHVLMVQRQIGLRAKGTGGTFFKDYLASTLTYSFFPELFEFRNELTQHAGGEVMEEKSS